MKVERHIHTHVNQTASTHEMLGVLKQSRELEAALADRIVAVWSFACKCDITGVVIAIEDSPSTRTVEWRIVFDVNGRRRFISLGQTWYDLRTIPERIKFKVKQEIASIITDELLSGAEWERRK